MSLDMTQLGYVRGASDTPFIGDTIGMQFDRIVERFAERDALIVRHRHVRWTYRELKERVDAFAAGLLAHADLFLRGCERAARA
jgi:fatty-acyl-CoA synthase